MTDAHALLALAEEAARSAGVLVASRTTGIEVAATKSSPTDVVTAVDIASEELIRDRLLGARPDDGFLGEEGDDIPSASGVVWVADPIDGTVNFLYGIPGFSVSIAAEVDGVAVAAVVHNPTNGETFTATQGGGARLDGDPIRVSTVTDLSHTLVGTGFHYRSDVRTHQAAEFARMLPQVRDVRRMGSAALDLCSVACGRLDAYVERGLKPWDLAAGQLILREAGGRVGGLNGSPAGELLTAAAAASIYDSFHECLVTSGFADWPMPEWP